jgi:MYXO-CTERM domain-containing protein
VQSDNRSNWARWQPKFSEAGEYELEVYVDPTYALHQRARYELVSGGKTTEIIVDQGEASGWHSLGSFDFEAGAGQSLSLFDNGSEPVGEMQQLVADNIRLTRIGNGGGGGDGFARGCGCESSGSGHGGGAAILFLCALIGLGRRRRLGS